MILALWKAGNGYHANYSGMGNGDGEGSAMGRKHRFIQKVCLVQRFASSSKLTAEPERTDFKPSNRSNFALNPRVIVCIGSGKAGMKHLLVAATNINRHRARPRAIASSLVKRSKTSEASCSASSTSVGSGMALTVLDGRCVSERVENGAIGEVAVVTVGGVTIRPETKDWTWTIGGPCPDCGYDGPNFDVAKTAQAVRALACDFPVALMAHLGRSVRPNPQTWAPVEYACHVRDVFALYEHRLGLMLNQDAPTFPNWDQDETAVSDRYLEQDPAVVASELAAAGESLAVAFEKVEGEAWARTGHRSDGKDFSIKTFAIYMIHDPAHHFWDITGQRASLAESP
jgi:hypothetical protein